jgi:hypothetical protein
MNSLGLLMADARSLPFKSCCVLDRIKKHAELSALQKNPLTALCHGLFG